VSCDGSQKIQDKNRKYVNGAGTSQIVEKNIKQALTYFPLLPVNAVYNDETLECLPETLDYLVSLGVNNIYLNPDISANWTKIQADKLPQVYDAIGDKFLGFYSQGKPKFINLIDSKIALLLRGGYKPLERCRMGTGELAFSTTGNLYPCERLLGSDDGKNNCLGNLDNANLKNITCKTISSVATNNECKKCGVKDYCMNWCGCTNYYSTGSYSKVSPFICAHETAAINVAYRIIQKMEDNWPNLYHHVNANPLVNVITKSNKTNKTS
jgi:uncharacterized protein